MPYVSKVDRAIYGLPDTVLPAATAGQLNFQFTELIKRYIDENGGLNYARINDIIGALEGAKLEFYARIVRPYEDTKIAENGDVYGCL